jgi:glycosyltransferase involved in cell wall biosynthesis
MKILFIAPLPPPTHGQSLAADVLFQSLRERHEVRVVNMAKPTPKNAWERIRRSAVVLGFLRAVATKKRDVDVIYLTVSESTLGNLKDLCIYMLCHDGLDRMFIHMLGGAGMHRILKRRGIQYRLNRFFISRMRGVIVEGRMQAATFAAVAPAEKIHIRNNFAEEFLFFSEPEVRQKFSGIQPLNVLFLSNLYTGKGHNELVDGYLGLRPAVRDRFRITFVGGFESSRDRRDFLAKIDDDPGLSYIGPFIAGSQKRALYGKSHIFCLPTYYPFEGQPISILEAYATGCVVVTTEHSGIPEVFQDGVNGFAVETRSPESIRRVFEQVAENPDALVEIALANRNVAYDRYRTATYLSALTGILESSVS